SPEFRAYVEQVVSSRLRDAVGRRDFALHADGAEVAEDLTWPSPNSTASFGRRLPEFALQDDNHIGQCWHIAGGSGQLAILLPTFIYPTHISIDHIPIEVAADIGEAPKNMYVWGVVDGKLNHARYLNLTSGHTVPSARGRLSPPVAGNHSYVLLAALEYDIHAPSHIQTFPIDSHIIYSRMYFAFIVLEIVDNWGSSSTCLYRIRIHGD
ncbi:hypothetical protein FKP32DRAFT_1556856, partial [Trametes sanguinea]